MKHLLMLLFALLLSACITIVEPPETATPPGEASPTAESSPEATATANGTATPTLPSPTITMPPTHTATPTSTPVPTVSPAENLLLCWGFECGWRYQPDSPDGSLKVPLAWTAFWGGVPDHLEIAQLKPRSCSGFMPAVEVEQHRTHVKEGMFSGRVIQAYRACSAGLYQTIDVKPGYTYLVSALLFNWSTDSPAVDSPSTSYIRSWIGVDPSGGKDLTAASVVWSNEESARDKFAYVELKARAAGDKLTVFLLSVPNFPVARSDSFWDAVGVLEIASPPLPTPTPIAASTPGPIIEATPLGGFPDVGIGTLAFDVLTNLRECPNADPWGLAFDPTVSCPLLATDEGAANTLPPGTKTQVWEWRTDRYGNQWAWFGGYAAVACYKGVARGKFYPDVEPSEFEQLKSSGALPAPINPCSLIGG